MKTINVLRLSVAVILTICFASCHKKNTQGRLVPKDAAVVMVIDGQALSSKLSWDDIKQNPLFQKELADNSIPVTLRSVLNNPDSSGANIKSDIIFFVEKDSIGGYAAVEGSIKDSALFRNYCMQIMKGGTITQKDGITFICNYPGCIGWNNEKFVAISDAPAMSGMDAYSRRLRADSIDAGGRDISATCGTVFALEKDNSLATNDKFTNLFKEPGDIRFWINAGTLYSKMFTAGPLAMLNLDDYYKDNVTTAALSFDNGKISINTKSYMNEKLLALYKQYVNGKINEDMLQRMPGTDVTAAIALNFNPAVIRDVLKQINMDGIANEQLKQVNLTTDDIINAFKGDLVYGATDLKMQQVSVAPPEDGIPYKSVKETPSGNFIFAASIGDKDAFNKVLDVAKNFLHQSGMTDSSGNLPYAFDNNGTYFVVSNTKENTSKYLGSSTNNFDFISKINGAPLGGYVNLHSLLLAFKNNLQGDSTGQVSYDATLKMWDNIYIKGGGLDGDVSTGSVEINLIDKTTNSLKQLNQYIAILSATYQKEQDKLAAERAVEEKENSMLYAPDTSLVAPPTAPSN